MFFIFFGWWKIWRKITKDFNMRPPRKINVGLAKDARKYFFIREEWPFADKGIWINRRLAYYGGIGRKRWQSFFLESAIQELALDKSQLLDTGLAKVLASTEKLTVLLSYLSCFSGSRASPLRIDCFVSPAPAHFNTLMIYIYIFPYFRGQEYLLI